jgi:hypothetical protein
LLLYLTVKSQESIPYALMAFMRTLASVIFQKTSVTLVFLILMTTGRTTIKHHSNGYFKFASKSIDSSCKIRKSLFTATQVLVGQGQSLLAIYYSGQIEAL